MFGMISAPGRFPWEIWRQQCIGSFMSSRELRYSTQRLSLLTASRPSISQQNDFQNSFANSLCSDWRRYLPRTLKRAKQNSLDGWPLKVSSAVTP